MSTSVPYMPMSLDGYIADVNDHLGGDDDHRLAITHASAPD